jgi:hypothetical protein
MTLILEDELRGGCSRLWSAAARRRFFMVSLVAFFEGSFRRLHNKAASGRRTPKSRRYFIVFV